MAKFSIRAGELYPADMDTISYLTCEYGGITSLDMDADNKEGIIGTNQGYICYVHYTDRVIIPLVQKVDPSMEAIRFIDYDMSNNKVFLTSCGDKTSNMKLYTTATIDNICEFK